jgi:serine/threonine-protein kinase
MSAGRIGPYRILEPLGAGAHGEVFLAEDTRLGRRVALKTLRDLSSHDMAETRRRLLHEARAAARLNHPHIAAIYDVVEEPDALHIVMEYVPGQTLASRLRQGALPPPQVLDLGVQLASALAHAHGHGVIHRDLKPANIALDAEGHAKILDFGVARTVAAMPSDLGTLSTPTTDERVLVGTPPYMPPEHIMGAPVDERGDLYSLGVTLFEALTARRPFEAKDLVSLAQAILTAPTPRVGDTIPDLPSGLDAVVFRAMARDRAERYDTAGDLESDLKRLAARVMDAPTASRIGREPIGRLRRRPVMATTATLAVLLAVGALALSSSGQLLSFGGGGSGPPGPHVVAVLPLLDSSKDPQNEALAAGVSDSLITALSKLDGVTVVSRAAMLKHRERKQDPDAIAREVGASLLVDGSLQRSGDALRLTLSLLQPGTNVVQWQESYDGDFKDVLRLQREVAAAVAQSLRVKLTPQTRARLQQKPTENVEALADYSQARAFMERPDVKGNLDRGIELFQSAIRKDPHFASAHAGLGEAYWRRYQETKAEEWSVRARDSINEALRLDPEDDAVRLSLASIYRGMGRVSEAIEESRRVIASNPNSDEAHRLLGKLLIDSGQKDEGLAELKQAVSLRPNYWRAHYTQGIEQYGAGRYPEAIASFRRVTELQPDNAWGYQMLGTAYHAQDDVVNAVPAYETAIKLGNAKAYSNLGLLHYNAGNLAEAARCYEKALAIEPSCLKHYSLGDIYARVGRPVDSRTQYQQATEACNGELRVNPRDASAMFLLAVSETKLGRSRDADGHIRAAVALKPDDADVRFGEAIVRAWSGQTDQALGALGKALAQGYSPQRASQDPSLSAIRNDPRFSEVLRSHRALSKGSKP